MATWKGRGLDFEHRFRTSRWAEDLLQEAITKSGKLLCFKLGLSQIAADNRPEAGSTQYKVPDLILFSPDKLTPSDRQWLDQHDLIQISPETMLADDSIRSLFSKACCAIEVEFSPYRAAEMKQRHWKRKLLSDLDRRPLKHANPPTAPNIWVKLEDLPRIQAWEGTFGIPVVIAHLFDQEAFAIPLITLSDFEADWPDQSNEAIRRQLTTGIFRKTQSYDRVDAQGAGETKVVFVVTPDAAQQVGVITDVTVRAQIGLSASKKYVAHVLFEGGAMTFSKGFLDFLSSYGRPSRIS